MSPYTSLNFVSPGLMRASAAHDGVLAAGAAPAEPAQAALAGAASASPVAVEAWCTVTDRLRRLRADLEV